MLDVKLSHGSAEETTRRVGSRFHPEGRSVTNQSRVAGIGRGHSRAYSSNVIAFEDGPPGPIVTSDAFGRTPVRAEGIHICYLTFQLQGRCTAHRIPAH